MATEFLRPDADTSTGNWTASGGGSLFAAIDETIADDNDYIQSGDTPSADICKIRLSNPSSTLSTPMTAHIRYKCRNAFTSLKVVVRLLQATTEIASWTYVTTTGIVAADEALTAPQIAAITDQTDLYFEFTASPSVFAPSDLGADLSAWFDANGGTYMLLSGGRVTQWTDRSGNGRHVSSAGSFNDPPYASNAITCTPGSVDGFDTWAVALPANVFDCYIVGDPVITGNFRPVLNDPTQNTYHMTIGSTSNELGIYANGVKSSGLIWEPSGLRQAMTRITNATTGEMNLDAAVSLSAVNLGGETMVLTTVPRIGMDGSTQGFGDLYEMIFTTTGLSLALRQKIEGYLAWKWDGILGGSTLVTALPALHPYKSAAP